MNTEITFPEEFPILEGDRISLLPFEYTDVDRFFDLRSDKEFMKYLGLHPMKSRAEARSRIAAIIQAFETGEGISWKISLKDETELIGYLGFWRLDYRHIRGEIGFGLDQEYQQRGFMSEALPLIMGYGFRSLGLHTIMADVDPMNQAPRQLLEKFNFEKEGYLRENYFFNGSFTDSVYYGIREQDFGK